MKKAFWTIAAVLIMASLSMAQTPAPPIPVSVYAGGALSLPSAPTGFRDGWKLGYHGTLGVGYKVAPRFQLVGKVEYHKFNSDIALLSGSAVDGGGIKVLMFGADGRLSLGAPIIPIKPYVFGGLGMASFETETYTSPDPLVASLLNAGVAAKQSKVYFNIGGGVEFAAGPKASLFLQVRYVNIGTEGGSTGFIPITAGVKLF